MAAHAYRYYVNAKAWRMFCDECGIESDKLLHGLPGHGFMKYCDETMSNAAPSPEEVAEMFPDAGSKRSLVTVDDVIESWRGLYGQLL